ncbi:2TM domain-containing protein [Zeaxanthinibacter sp. PT1]|uniref:2TM domain-containing protein n=1 Tax=Zeaxanthinibacter TaxID=561554 RepID=UPI00234A820C|nr:2TM domain-containing protein [Zeaxanthinibacter sp. PT1]MDC6350029.1 2TM domain-containing protein [Zeaxanthinibacter sp. PT1]
MFNKNKKEAEIAQEQHEQLEYAQHRVRQKKRLYRHFVLFLVGSVFLVLINKILKYGEAYDWFIWAITFWAFLFIVHLVNVFVTNKFMGRDWERKQRETLVRKQREKLARMQKEIETDFPESQVNKRIE